jgi:heme exporter protein D
MSVEMSEFFAMGGYAWYVWMSYGAAALAVIIEVAAVRARRRRTFEQLRMSAEPEPRSASLLGARGHR